MRNMEKEGEDVEKKDEEDGEEGGGRGGGLTWHAWMSPSGVSGSPIQMCFSDRGSTIPRNPYFSSQTSLVKTGTLACFSKSLA